MVATGLPVLDLTALRGGPDGRSGDLSALARQLDEACRAHGFFMVTGHGVPLHLRDAAFDASRRFFALPEPTKSRWHVAQSPIKRGFDPLGWQSLDIGQPVDWKESFYLGVDRGPDDALVRAGVPQQGPNQWPDEQQVPGFHRATTAWFDALSSLGRRLMGLLALALDLPRDHFERYLSDPMPVLRLLHYPPRPATLAPGQVGCGAHTDWGGITLLAQDAAGGLQVWLGEGAPGRALDAPGWLDVPYLPDSLVVNLGDMMARWTNDRWRSTLHRVLPQPAGQERYSMAFFYDIDYHAEVAALPGCVSAERPARYRTVTAGEHIVEMYRRTTVVPDPA